MSNGGAERCWQPHYEGNLSQTVSLELRPFDWRPLRPATRCRASRVSTATGLLQHAGQVNPRVKSARHTRGDRMSGTNSEDKKLKVRGNEMLGSQMLRTVQLSHPMTTLLPPRHRSLCPCHRGSALDSKPAHHVVVGSTGPSRVRGAVATPRKQPNKYLRNCATSFKAKLSWLVTCRKLPEPRSSVGA
jgi:hypothetical protein